MEACTNSTAGYRLRVYRYPCGVTEAVSVFIPSPQKPATAPASPRVLSEEELQRRREDNARRAAARAKSAVRRLCLSAGCDRLLTLTYRENVTDTSRAWEDFARFVRKVRVRYPKWVYVAVAERQKRGAVHFHLAVRGFQDVGYLRACWLHIAGQGNIDVTPPRGKRSSAARAASCSRYITKYMLKEARDAEEFHRYRSSHITVPLEVIRLESLNALQAGNEALAAVSASGGRVRDVWFGAEFGLTWCVGWAGGDP